MPFSNVHGVCCSYNCNNTKSNQVKNHEKQDLDKVLLSFWWFQNWEQEWQVLVTQLSNLMGHFKPSSPDQGWRTRTRRLLSWKDGLCMYINATAILQLSNTLPLCANSKVNRSLLCSSQHQDDPPLAGAPQLALQLTAWRWSIPCLSTPACYKEIETSNPMNIRHYH